MVEANPTPTTPVPNKKTVMVLGSLGTGKSCVMNRLSGLNLEEEKEPFESKMQATGCTQEPNWKTFDQFNLLDTPGLNDPQMMTADWASRLNKWSAERQQAGGEELSIDLTVLIYKQKPRPDTADVNCLAVLKHTIAELNLDNLCVIFTFCDQINPKKKLKAGEKRFDQEYATGWFNNALRKDSQGNFVDGIPEIPSDKIFLFRGEEGMAGDETTPEELAQFITSCLPQQRNATSIKKFEYTEYLQTAKQSGNADLQAAANQEIELLKKALQNQEETIRQMRENNKSSQEAAERRFEQIAQMANKTQQQEPGILGQILGAVGSMGGAALGSYKGSKRFGRF